MEYAGTAEDGRNASLEERVGAICSTYFSALFFLAFLLTKKRKRCIINL